MQATGATLVQLVVFDLEGQHYALPLAAVERVVHAVEVTPMNGGPEVVLGVVDMGGRILPVLNLRRRLGLPGREMQPSDRFLIVRAGRRVLALTVDGAEGVIALPASALVPANRIFPGFELIEGVVCLEDGLVLIQDLRRFLTLEEDRMLEDAMKGDGP